jgi:FkbM family methyltransferase
LEFALRLILPQEGSLTERGEELMPFISYGQNSEDVVLWRALRDIGTGFYVDVGAGDPKADSVTYAFYECGWSGINIEPLDDYFARLAEARRRDTNLKVAVGREAGPRTFYAIEGTGLSTLYPEIAARHKSAGYAVSETRVHVLTLERILEDFSARTIHFLKIDAEGAEAEVLQSVDLKKTRPWIILVEATDPNSPITVRGAWERLITSQGYTFCYFDGLNCFYVADERAQLKERLALPPNVFDDYVRFAEWSDRQKAAALESEIASLKEDMRELEEALQAEQRQSASLYDALQAEQLQTAKLLNAIQSEQMSRIRLQEAVINHLIGRTQELEANLAALSNYRGVMGGIRKIGDRLTGGGMRSLAERVALQLRGGRHAAPTETQSVVEQSTPATGQSPPECFSNAASLTPAARRIYLRLRSVVSEGSAGKSNR